MASVFRRAPVLEEWFFPKGSDTTADVVDDFWEATLPLESSGMSIEAIVANYRNMSLFG